MLANAALLHGSVMTLIGWSLLEDNPFGPLSSFPREPGQGFSPRACLSSLVLISPFPWETVLGSNGKLSVTFSLAFSLTFQLCCVSCFLICLFFRVYNLQMLGRGGDVKHLACGKHLYGLSDIIRISALLFKRQSNFLAGCRENLPNINQVQLM